MPNPAFLIMIIVNICKEAKMVQTLAQEINIYYKM